MSRATPEWVLTRARKMKAEGLSWSEIGRALGVNARALAQTIARRERRGDDAFAKEAA